MRNDGFQVYDRIDADLRPFANDGEVKYPRACGQEDLVFDSAAEERGVGADKYCIANLNRVIPGSSHTPAQRISSPEINQAHLMGSCNHGEPQWSTMSD